LYNEPQGSGQVDIVLPLLNEIYASAVQANPRQPLTFGLASEDLTEPLSQCDPEMYELIRKEKQRQVIFERKNKHIYICTLIRIINQDSWFGNDCIRKFYITWCIRNTWIMFNK